MVTFLFALLAAILVVQIVLLAGLLMLSGRIFRTERPTFKAALKVAGLITLVGVVVGIPVEVLTSKASSGGVVILVLAIAAAVYFVYWKLIRRLLQSSGKKAFAALIFSMAISTVGVFGLAYAIRGYLYEAFVVPTGAMAPTIIGTHRDVVCPNCGRQFAVSMSDTLPGPGGLRQPLPASKLAKCINCGELVGVPYDQITSGDRMLVEKFAAPKRWDLVVYRMPAEATNFVKRYAGLPGETLDIADGDLFINDNRVAKQPNEQLDLWFPVNDTQFAPKKVDDNTPRWEPKTKSEWSAAGSGWRFKGAEQDEAELQFRGVVNDRLDYNAIQEEFSSPPTVHVVGDVRILCDLERFTGDGPWSIVWEFDGRVVRCAIRSTGDVELACDASQNGNEAQRATGKLVGDVKSPKQIALAVRDGFTYVLENDRICASLQVAPVKRLDVPLRMSKESGKASIRAGHCDLSIGRIQLARDIYYSPPEFPDPSAVRLPISLTNDEIFFLGDNNAQSRDSRYMGPSMYSDVIGVTRAIYWPTSRWRKFP